MEESVSQHKQHHSLQPQTQQQHPSSLKKIVAVASIAAGVQFGWALQLSLLTPYIQLLGIPHKWTSYIWLCGPISGITVQPIVGYYSDKCHSRWGRRRPFIVAGALLILLAIFLISYAVDLGRLFGDPLGSSRAKPRAITIFVIGFWVLDIGNNTLPCRAFLADLAGKNQRRTRIANAVISFFLAVGNILGYAAGSFSHLHKFLPFTKSKACDIGCANLKTCFFLSALLLLSLTIFALTYVQEKPLVRFTDTTVELTNGIVGPNNDTVDLTGPTDGPVSHTGPTICAVNRNDENQKVEPLPITSMSDIVKAIKHLPRPMWVLLLVTCLNWVAWFPFLMFDTDWMGREVYGGVVGEGKTYESGVRAGAIGLMLNSVVLGFTSLGLELLARKLGGVKKLLGYTNFLLALCLGLTVVIAKLAKSSRNGGAGSGDGDGNSTHSPLLGIRVSSLALFALFGVPLAVTFSIPCALASIYCMSSRVGQGLALGILNISVCIPQIVVSFSSGPWDALFGGGNLPAFIVGAFAAIASGIIALTMLPAPIPELPRSRVMGTESPSCS